MNAKDLANANKIAEVKRYREGLADLKGVVFECGLGNSFRAAPACLPNLKRSAEADLDQREAHQRRLAAQIGLVLAP